MEPEEIRRSGDLEKVKSTSEISFDIEKAMDCCNDNSSSYNRMDTSADSNQMNISCKSALTL
jgi:hypothetical protein